MKPEPDKDWFNIVSLTANDRIQEFDWASNNHWMSRSLKKLYGWNNIGKQFPIDEERMKFYLEKDKIVELMGFLLFLVIIFGIFIFIVFKFKKDDDIVSEYVKADSIETSKKNKEYREKILKDVAGGDISWEELEDLASNSSDKELRSQLNGVIRTYISKDTGILKREDYPYYKKHKIKPH